MGDWLRELADARLSTADPGTDPSTALQRSTVRNALRLRREAEAFEARWPEPAANEPMLPALSWTQLERQLADLTDTPAKAQMARELVSATRKMSGFKPPEMVLREILCMAWALLDESFQPEAEGDMGAMP